MGDGHPEEVRGRVATKASDGEIVGRTVGIGIIGAWRPLPVRQPIRPRSVPILLSYL